MRAKAPQPAAPTQAPPTANPLAPLSPLQAAAGASPRASQLRALSALTEQAAKPRSFIRTWISLRKRAAPAG